MRTLSASRRAALKCQSFPAKDGVARLGRSPAAAVDIESFEMNHFAFSGWGGDF